MAGTTPTGFDDSVRPDDVVAEDVLDDAVVEEGEPLTDPDGPFPDEANEVDVLDQREEVPPDEDDEVPDA